MSENAATMTSKGQITIPKAVREHLHLQVHDQVIFSLEADGSVRLSVPKYPTVASLAGAAGSLPHPLSWEEMRRIAREDHVQAQQKSDAQP